MHRHLRGDSSREACVDYAVSLSGTPAPALRPSALRAPAPTECPPAREVPAGGSGAPVLSLERLLFFSERRFLEVLSPLLHCAIDGIQASSSFRHLARHARRHPGTIRMGIRERLNARRAGTRQCSQATGNATFDVPELARKTPSACPLRVARIPNQDERTHAQ